MGILLVPFLTFMSVVAIGGALIAARAARRVAIEQRLRDALPDTTAALQRGSPLVDAVGMVGQKLSSKGPSPGLKVELTRAGYYGKSAAAVYLGAKVLLFIAGIGVLGLLLLPAHMDLSLKLLLMFMGASTLFFIPNLVVAMRRRRRLTEVRQHLPDAFDLLEICVCSGMGLDMAWNCVADDVRRVSTVLADEMALTNLEMHLGAQRAVAMRHMAERTGADEITSLVGVLVQSERFGTSIADALRTFAASMRLLRSQRAEEAAEKMAVKLLFPMILFILPALYVVLVGPAGLRLAEFLKR